MKLRLDDRVFEFPEGSLKVSEARLIQKATGMTVPEWAEALNRMDAYAVTGLIWILRRREGETSLAFDDVDFELAALEILDEPAVPTEADDAAAASPAA